MCTPTSEMQALAGEDCRTTSRGMYFINTNAVSPFATGRITESYKTKTQQQVFFNPITHVDPFQKEIDSFGKLEGNFNNLPYLQYNDVDNVQIFFTNHGSNRIVHDFVNHLRHQHVDDKKISTKNVKNLTKAPRPNSRLMTTKSNEDF